jgi:mRNA interferase YafQ
MERRNKDMAKLYEVVTLLRENFELPAKFKDHPLSGNRADLRDCHLEPD